MQDGPNPDAKEQLGGFMILELPSLDHALDWGARCPAASGGAVEIRPLSPRFGDSIDTALATFALGWHYEAGIQFVRLMLGGAFDKHPDLQIILGHWGEVILFYLERLNSLARVAKLRRPVTDYIRNNLYVTSSGMWSQSYLQRTLELVGPERILFSTDYPYQYRPGGAGLFFLNEAALSPEEKELFAHGNWERLTR